MATREEKHSTRGRARLLIEIAPQSFRRWLANRADRNEGRPRVILWPDTFNNNFRPQALIAAVEVLESAGYQVRIAKRPLCCGRPLYEWGWLSQAKQQLADIMDGLGDKLAAGIPIVGREPACLSVFKDELLRNTGYCGMAGSFGLEKQHYDLSLKIGERVLLPAVRSADAKTMIVTSGYICSGQISQATGRQAQHLAQVLQLALYEGEAS